MLAREKKMTSAALSISLGLLMLGLAVSALPKRHTYGGEYHVGGGNTRHQCVEMPPPNICRDYFGMENWYARFPNSRGQTRDEAIDEFSHYLDLLYQNNYCSHMLYASLCFHYFPKCSLSHPDVAATPCREVCEEVSAACLPIAYALQGNDLNIPEHLNCTNFESIKPSVTGSAETTCNSGSNGSSGSGSGEASCSTSAPEIVACPNASIHVDFCPPLGSLEYVVSEGDGVLEVCLTLANVGSYSSSVPLTTEVTVQLSTTATRLTFLSRATEGEDYGNASATVVFPVGSRKLDKQCIAVPLIDDCLVEAQESFSMTASILSPSSANIGGDLKSSSRSIEVIIVDNDAYTPPGDVDRKCGDTCNIRDRVSGSTFKTNCYTYVAQVEVIGRRDFDDYSMLDVCIISCWSWPERPCPPSGDPYSITVCPNCETYFVSGVEYVIAGVHDSNGKLLVLNSKKEGLFGRWKRKYRSISQWWQVGLDYHQNNPNLC